MKPPLVKLLRSGRRPVIAFFDEICPESALALYEIIAKVRESPLLLLSSPGGDVSLMAGLGTALAKKYPELEVRVVGTAQSAALDLLQFAALRTATPCATFMSHPSSIETTVTAETAKATSRLLENGDEKLLRLYAKRTGKPLKTWRNWFRIERNFDAEKALELGLVDSIVGEI